MNIVKNYFEDFGAQHFMKIVQDSKIKQVVWFGDGGNNY